MRVAITGASGLVGSALSAALESRGDEVVAVSRSPRRGQETIVWDPRRGFEPADVLSGIDAVVNLAGETIAGRWTAAKKARIHQSRVDATRSVVAALAALAGGRARPRILINASAVGLYGDRGDELLDEDSAAGPEDDFLVEVTRDWEASAGAVAKLDDPPVRLCLARFGLVLAREGGALRTMVTPFRLGLGGVIGDGRQWMAWIHLRDAVAALLFMLDRDDARGPYNLVSVAPARNAEFCATLGRVLRRPTLLPVPKFGVRLALGQMGEALLLHGQRAQPSRLLEAGFSFEFSELEAALRDLVLR